MNIDRFLELEAKVKSVIGESFEKAIQKSASDFVLLMARGGYHKHLDRPNLDLTPFVLEDREDFLMDLTRKRFFVKYMNNYVNRLNSNISLTGEDLEYEVNIQLMVYSHIWESHLFLNQLVRLASIQKGEGYLWKSESPYKSKKNFVDIIIGCFKKTDENMMNLIQQSYSGGLRNAFAHSSYFIEGNRIQLNMDVLFRGRCYSFEEWDEMFVRSVLLSYHLNDMLLNIKNQYIEASGDGPIAINMPMKYNHKKMRSVLIKPESIDGNEEKVRFRYMKRGEISPSV